MKIILASGSPRRKELLEQAGYTFTVEVSDADENVEGLAPAAMVEELSLRKAMAVAQLHMNTEKMESICSDQEKMHSEINQEKKSPEINQEKKGPEINQEKKISEIDQEETMKIIGSDTIVVLDEVKLGKPSNEEDAMHMLLALSGRNHEVYTGVTVLTLEEGKLTKKEQFYECTKVKMRKMTVEEIGTYIATGEPMDKAGAYGIQGRAAVFISGIEGDYYNVVGLPICHLSMILDQEGM